MEQYNLDQYLSAISPVKALELYHCLSEENPGRDSVTLRLSNLFFKHLTKEMIAVGLSSEKIFAIAEVLQEPMPLSDCEQAIQKDESLLAVLPLQAEELNTVSSQLQGQPALISHGWGITPILAAIIQTVRLNCPATLHIFPNGDLIIWVEALSDTYSNSEREQIENQSHISISISGLLKRFLRTPDTAFQATESFGADVQRVLDLILEGSSDRLDIIFKNGQMKALEISRSHPPGTNLSQLIEAHDFQDVTMKRHRGKTTYIQSRQKIYFR